jgi:hypothetical protein
MIDGYPADSSRSPSPAPSPRRRCAVGAGRAQARASQRGAFSLASNHPPTGTGPVVRSRKIESQNSTVHRDSGSKFQISLARFWIFDCRFWIAGFGSDSVHSDRPETPANHRLRRFCRFLGLSIAGSSFLRICGIREICGSFAVSSKKPRQSPAAAIIQLRLTEALLDRGFRSGLSQDSKIAEPPQNATAAFQSKKGRVDS